MIANQLFSNMISSPVRTFRGRVEIYEGSTLASICRCNDRLKNFTVERVGEKNKFFGFGICQKLKVELLDTNRELNITTANTLEVEFGIDDDYIYPCPAFYVTEVNRDENNNNLNITAYDALYKAREHTVAELALPGVYSIRALVDACAVILGVPVNIDTKAASSFNINYFEGANFDGTETIRAVLDAIAEATQTIYYINNMWELTFKRLDIDGGHVAIIDKEKYRTLQSQDAVTLTTITHTTELGDNITASEGTGATQYIRSNPLLELRDDVADILNDALAAVGGMSASPFVCDWRGNFLLEPGDKISLVTKDNELITSYVFDDVFSFDGALSGILQWAYAADGSETASNPSTLGEALSQTFAKVDKVNKQIDLVASQSSEALNEVSALKLTTDTINASVEKTENDITALTKKTNLAVTADAVQIAIDTSLGQGVDKVKTSTGYTFNDEGLKITKGGELTTTISDDGMTVSRSSTVMLRANNQGVEAVNLYASTYLIIGNNSRLETYNGDRTACFWIGG